MSNSIDETNKQTQLRIHVDDEPRLNVESFFDLGEICFSEQAAFHDAAELDVFLKWHQCGHFGLVDGWDEQNNVAVLVDGRGVITSVYPSGMSSDPIVVRTHLAGGYTGAPFTWTNVSYAREFDTVGASLVETALRCHRFSHCYQVPMMH